MTKKKKKPKSGTKSKSETTTTTATTITPATPEPSKAALTPIPKPPRATLCLTQEAAAKAAFLRDNYQHEIGAFGVALNADDPLLIHDFVVVKQEVSCASVEFDDQAVSDLFNDCFDEGIHPYQCGRVWMHTHPSGVTSPSGTDEQTFEKVFGSCDWAVMLIFPKGAAKPYCCLQFNGVVSHRVEIPVEILPYEADTAEWEAEVAANVTEEVFIYSGTAKAASDAGVRDSDLAIYDLFEPYDSEPRESDPFYFDAQGRRVWCGGNEDELTEFAHDEGYIIHEHADGTQELLDEDEICWYPDDEGTGYA